MVIFILALKKPRDGVDRGMDGIRTAVEENLCCQNGTRTAVEENQKKKIEREKME